MEAAIITLAGALIMGLGAIGAAVGVDGRIDSIPKVVPTASVPLVAVPILLM